MKYGLLYYKDTPNIGDDIQSYASSLFLPQVDCLVERESLHGFASAGREPVATVMNAWFLHKKWNWPPSEDILPFLVAFHYHDFELAPAVVSPPIKLEFLSGCGGEYLMAYGPVGCRDMFTLEVLEGLGIPAYFSGCLTLTLPQMPKIGTGGEYICLVDAAPKTEKKIRTQCEGTGIEAKAISHIVEPGYADKPWEERKASVEEYLTLYQNAKCVVTSRLHCALPCLALGTPVLMLNDSLDDIRFDPYVDWLHCATPKDYEEGNCGYDVVNPAPNKNAHIETRDKLISSVNDFIQRANDAAARDEIALPPAYTEIELLRWQNDTMRKALDTWQPIHKKNVKSIQQLEKKNMWQAKTIDGLGSDISNLKASRAFRLGKSLTLPIRAIRRIFKPK